MNIYVGNLSYEVTDEDLKEAFSPHGEVESARTITDRETGRQRGFGFVEMPSSNEAQAAIQAINGTEIKGRTVTVNEARPRSNDDRGRGPSRW
jgi:RNA recognition motif-containing protein